MSAYIETGDMDIEDGNNFAFINRLVPDIKFKGNTGGATVTVTIKGRKYPLESLTTLDTATVSSTTTQNNIRARARQFVLRFAYSGDDFGWRLGAQRVDSRKAGRR